jgi:hypothetical protein
LAGLNLQALAFAASVDLEGKTGFDASKDADEAIRDAVAGGDLAGEVFLAECGGVEIANLAACGVGVSEGLADEAGGGLLGVVGEVLEEDAVGAEVTVHAVGVAQGAEVAAEDEAVEAGQDA